MSKFFTADSHFSYKNGIGIIERDFRPFKNVEEMNKKMIEQWNLQAGKGDIIYHLGDFINYNSRDCEDIDERFSIVKKIKAKVVLILGNNEQRLMLRKFNNDFEKFRKYLLSLGFADVLKDGMYLEVADNEFYLTHCPKDCKKWELNLFGHVHNTVFVKRYGFNVGVDIHYFKLFTEDDIRDMVDRRIFFDENVYD